MRRIFILVFSLLIVRPAVGSEVATWLPGIAKISMSKDGSSRTGTGFVVAVEEGAAFVVTAAHVIAGGENIQVTFQPAPFAARTVKKILSDEATDLAALWVPGSPNGVKALSFSAEEVAQGDPVDLVGYSRQAQTPRVITGTMSGFAGSLLVINPGAEEGNSGGPLLGSGQVVGVVTQTESRRFAHAVPAMTVRFLLEKWRVPFVDGPSTDPSTPKPTEDTLFLTLKQGSRAYYERSGVSLVVTFREGPLGTLATLQLSSPMQPPIVETVLGPGGQISFSSRSGDHVLTVVAWNPLDSTLELSVDPPLK